MPQPNSEWPCSTNCQHKHHLLTAGFHFQMFTKHATLVSVIHRIIRLFYYSLVVLYIMSYAARLLQRSYPNLPVT